MHGAPAVSFPAGRPRAVGGAVGLLWTVGAGCCLASMSSAGAWGIVLLCVASPVVGAIAWLHLRRSSAGNLSFDGQHWSTTGAVPMRSGRLQVCLDLQSSMLLRLASAGHVSCWLWVESRRDPGRWADLRRAVYSRASSGADGGDPDLTPPGGGRSSAFR